MQRQRERETLQPMATAEKFSSIIAAKAISLEIDVDYMRGHNLPTKDTNFRVHHGDGDITVSPFGPINRFIRIDLSRDTQTAVCDRSGFGLPLQI